jgi:hypothetical protein
MIAPFEEQLAAKIRLLESIVAMSESIARFSAVAQQNKL